MTSHISVNDELGTALPIDKVLYHRIYLIRRYTSFRKTPQVSNEQQTYPLKTIIRRDSSESLLDVKGTKFVVLLTSQSFLGTSISGLSRGLLPVVRFFWGLRIRFSVKKPFSRRMDSCCYKSVRILSAGFCLSR